MKASAIKPVPLPSAEEAMQKLAAAEAEKAAEEPRREKDEEKTDRQVLI